MQDVPNTVVKRLQTMAETHPDADLLTAFAERSLGIGERSRVLEHLARCGDCREVVSLALPEPDEVAADRSVKAGAAWLNWPVLRWGVVTAGLSAVVLVGLLQYRERHVDRTTIASKLTPVEERSVASSAPSANAMPASREAVPTSPKVAQSPTENRRQLSRKNFQGSMAFNTQRTTPAAMPAATAQSMSPRVPAQPSGSVVAGGRLNSAAKLAPPVPSYGYGAGTRQGASTAVEVSPVPAEVQTETASLQADQLEVVGKAKPAEQQMLAPAVVTKSSPTAPVKDDQPALRWTISNNGTLQRSVDGGMTWQDVSVATPVFKKKQMTPPTNMTAVDVAAAAPATVQSDKSIPAAKMKSVAPSRVPIVFRAVSVSNDAKEVWAGGTPAALYHTVDGGDSWTGVLPADSGTVLTGDIVTIQFPDAQNVSVTTSSGENWSTHDGGQTWHKE
jgi:hypothetical protein